MSNYTMELRHVCEQLAGLTSEQIMLADYNTIIEAARPQLFNFSYPLYNPDHKAELETKIIKHYYMREISGETVGLFKLFLDRTLNEIMPYFNELYHSADLEYNPLHDIDITRQHAGQTAGSSVNESSRSGSTHNEGTLSANESGTSGNTRTEERGVDETVDRTDETTGSGSTSGSRSETRAMDETVNRTGSGTENGTTGKTTHTETETDSTGSSTGSKTSSAQYSESSTERNAYSDTPESSVQGVEGDGSGSGSGNVSDNYWLTDYRKITLAKSGSSSASENTTGSETGHSESSGDQTESGTSSNTTSTTGRDVTDRDETISGTDSGTSSSHTTGTGRTVTDRDENGTITDAGTTSGSRSEETTANGTSSDSSNGSSSFNNSDNWTEHVTGKEGSGTFASMILEYRETLLNIDMMIIEALEPCFMQIY